MPVEQKAVVLRDQEPESRACTSLYSCQEKPSPVVRGTVYPYTVHTVQLLTLHINWPQFQSHWAITLLWPAFVYNTGDLKLMWVYHFQQVHLEAESAFRECFKASHFSLQSIKSLLSRGTELLQVPVRSTKLKHLVSWQLILLKCLYHHEKKKRSAYYAEQERVLSKGFLQTWTGDASAILPWSCPHQGWSYTQGGSFQPPANTGHHSPVSSYFFLMTLMGDSVRTFTEPLLTAGQDKGSSC